jgi:hypothetical protein
MPTEEECFQIDEDDLELWLTTARDLNPIWFPSESDEAKETQEKKLLPG